MLRPGGEQTQISNVSMAETSAIPGVRFFRLDHLNFGHFNLFRISNFELRILINVIHTISDGKATHQ
jgi:hypothetical protein